MKTISYFLVVLAFSATGFSQEVEIELFASGFNDPLEFQTSGASNDTRIFIVEQGGIIKILDINGTVNPVPFLDISGQISSGGERGLLGLAFHPNYESNGYFFVNYTNPNGDTQVSRFSVNDTNPDIADPTSEFPIISYSQPYANHNGGCLAFGPDGYLYISAGDGGSGGDPGNRAQSLNVLLGKLLRLDIDNPSGGNNYGIPPDNPFLGNANAMDEIWAYGLRNPWRFSFDEVAGNIWIGDVGQGNVEEINCEPIAAAGLNYGWRCYEGSQEYDTSGCPQQSALTFPFAEYSSATGSGNCSITGGYVYRGDIYTDILGLYFFADYCSGLIGTIDASGTIMEHGNFSGNWVSFGKDAAGELYIVDIGGNIYKIKGGEMAAQSFDPNTISLLPNPSSGKVILKTNRDEISKVTVFSITGKKVFAGKSSSSKEIILDISNLNPGVYMVEIETENGSVVVKKILIE
ncbi:MAG TPA: PQQ-dependent sugar dehydrogenase [Flavobacteriaceae bacterium]|nr:PQQ-dependent sugar dehydrogenase [Flavobacteriaceae bacterium]